GREGAGGRGGETREQGGPGNWEREGGGGGDGRERLLHDRAAQAKNEPQATAEREVQFRTERAEQCKRRAADRRPAERRERYRGLFGSFPPADGEHAEQDEGQAGRAAQRRAAGQWNQACGRRTASPPE